VVVAARPTGQAPTGRPLIASTRLPRKLAIWPIMSSAAFFSAAISALVVFGRRRRERRLVAGARLERRQPLVAHVVAVRMAHQHGVHGAEARIVAAEHRLARVVERRTPVGSSRIIARSRLQSSPLCVPSGIILTFCAGANAGEGREHQRHEAARERWHGGISSGGTGGEQAAGAGLFPA
jgi:hypothetical protein